MSHTPWRKRARPRPAAAAPFAVDQVVLQGEQAAFNTLLGGPEGSPIRQGEETIEAWSRRLVAAAGTAPPRTVGLIPADLPLRAIHLANHRLIFLVEYPPGPRTLAWIRADSKIKYGEGVQSREVSVELPYVLFFITVSGEQYLGNSSVYFRTAPLGAADFRDALCDCHFLNCSPRAHGVYCWLCAQNLPQVVGQGQSLPAFVATVIDAFWFSGFNFSSEHHEGNSFFGLGRKGGRREICDPRVQTIEAWERATAEEPGFAVRVPWNPAERNVRDVFHELATVAARPWPVRTAKDAGNLILVTPNSKGDDDVGE